MTGACSGESTSARRVLEACPWRGGVPGPQGGRARPTPPRGGGGGAEGAQEPPGAPLAPSRCGPCGGAADARVALAGAARSASALAQMLVGPAVVLRARARPEPAQRRPRPRGAEVGRYAALSRILAYSSVSSIMCIF
eukprot:gene5235-biopygen8689